MFGKKVKRIEQIDSEPDEPQTEFEQGLSLEDLSHAYANVAAAKDASTEEETEDAEAPLAAPEASETDGLLVTTESVLESIFFLGNSDNRPIELDRLLGLFRDLTKEELEESIERLNQKYRSDNRVFEIIHDVGGYRMQLQPSMEIVRERFYGKVKETQLPQSAIDCLAIIAYQPGVSRDEVEKAWGQPANATLNLLVRKGLLRAEKEQGALCYYTTDRFLEVIGLPSIEDLPREEL